MPDQIAGVDGCPAGWIAVTWTGLSNDEPQARILTSFSDVLDLPAAVIAVDMPIGFPDRAIKGGRPACNAARARLGERRSSVFSVPSRHAVMCEDYREACRINLQHSDPPRKVSKQCFHLFTKMREIDALLTPGLQARVYEVHPELAFWAMNHNNPLNLPKKVKSRVHPPGMELRRNLLEAAGFPIARVRSGNWSRSAAAEDDLLDACATAWSARRIRDQEHICLPPDPPRDARGLRMEINA
jgi:predicted RNase H-like nuclease